MLDDGTYDALIVDAEEEGDGALRLDLAIVAGPHKGEVVVVRATGLAADAVGLLGLPATVVVEDGRPRVDVDT